MEYFIYHGFFISFFMEILLVSVFTKVFLGSGFLETFEKSVVDMDIESVLLFGLILSIFLFFSLKSSLFKPKSIEDFFRKFLGFFLEGITTGFLLFFSIEVFVLAFLLK